MGYSPQLRLFKVGEKHFQRKKDAKRARDHHNTTRPALKPAVVMRGPDHRRGESFNVSVRTPKQGAGGW